MNDSLTVLVAYLNGPNPDRVINSNHSKTRFLKLLLLLLLPKPLLKEVCRFLLLTTCKSNKVVPQKQENS